MPNKGIKPFAIAHSDLRDLFILSLLIFIFTACAKDIKTASVASNNSVIKLYEAINLKVGIDKSEVGLIVRRYFEKYGSQVETTNGEIQDNGNTWYLPIYSIWNGAELGSSLIIDKKTGNISNKNGNIIEAP